MFAQTRLILANDLRLVWRGLASGGRTRKAALPSLLLLAGHAAAFFVFTTLDRPIPLAVESLLWTFCTLIMVSVAINHATAALYERADFDLLLGAPVAPGAILLARLFSIVASALLGVSLFVLPAINGAAFAHDARYFAAYPTWLLLGAIAAATGVGLTLVLVRWLGLRRARTAAHIAAALAASTLFIASQVPAALAGGARSAWIETLLAIFRHPVLATLPHAARGNSAALGALAVVAVVACAVVTRSMERAFLSGSQEAASFRSSRPARPGRRTHRWTAGLFAATFRKDLRLILRDPLLLAQVLPSAFYFAPVFVVLMMRPNGGLPLLAPLGLLLATQFSKLLALVATAGDEGWDLIRLSPASELRVRLAKLAAGLAAPLALALVLWLVIGVAGHPWLALVSLVTGTATAAACAWIQVTDVRPSPRQDVFKIHYKRSFGRGLWRTVLINVLMSLGAAALGCLAYGWALPGAFLVTLTVVAVAAVFTCVQPRSIPEAT